MNHTFVAVIFIAVSSLVLVKAAVKGVNQPLKIRDSANLRDQKTNFTIHNKNESSCLNMTADKDSLTEETAPKDEMPDDNETSKKPTKKCYNRVLEEDYTNTYKVTVYTDSREDLEAAGKVVHDTICEGDSDWDKISAGALASLCCG